jgi:hypothetical protein
MYLKSHARHPRRVSFFAVNYFLALLDLYYLQYNTFVGVWDYVGQQLVSIVNWYPGKKSRHALGARLGCGDIEKEKNLLLTIYDCKPDVSLRST